MLVFHWGILSGHNVRVALCLGALSGGHNALNSGSDANIRSTIVILMYGMSQ